MVWRSSVVRHLSSSSLSFTMLKDLLLQNRFANQSQILCGAFLGRGNDILFAPSGSHDQDGRHAHIYSNKKETSVFQGAVSFDSLKMSL